MDTTIMGYIGTESRIILLVSAQASLLGLVGVPVSISFPWKL